MLHPVTGNPPEVPEFRLADDGEHVEWTHTCAVDLGDGPRPLRHAVTLPHDGGTWRVTNKDPLTVHPSINCTRCGTHGFITAGRWVPV